jgi:hypothetical protein
MPSRGTVLGSAGFGTCDRSDDLGFLVFRARPKLSAAIAQSVETLFAPCQAAEAHPPLAASQDPFLTEGRGDRGTR